MDTSSIGIYWKSKDFDFDKPPTSYLTKEDGDDLYYETVALEDTLYKINDLLENDQYKLKECLKIVYAEKHNFWIKKFNVRGVVSKVVKTIEVFVYLGPAEYELIEWRFKDTRETAPPEGRGRVPRPEIAPSDTPCPDIPPPSVRLVTSDEDPEVSEASHSESDDELVVSPPKFSEASSREVSPLKDNYALVDGGF